MTNRHKWYTGVIIHFNGVGYYYATTGGVKLSKTYKTVARLKHYVQLI